MAKRRSHGDHEEHMDESWLIPYADLLTLLLALFIVLFAASNVDAQKFSAIAQAFYSEFGGVGVMPDNSGLLPDYAPGGESEPVMPAPTPDEDENSDPGETAEQVEIKNLQRLQSNLENYFSQEGIIANISMHIDERGLVISLHDSVLFDSGSADIRPEHIPMLMKTGEIINKLDNYIRVEGHTDNVPIHSARFDTNWELSSVRATTVVKLFVASSGIPPEKLVAVGYGEYKTVADNGTADGRTQNRRVDIIILNSKYNSLEADVGDVPAVPA